MAFHFYIKLIFCIESINEGLANVGGINLRG